MLISIILPCYNCQDYVGQAIDSVLRQSYEDWELLIVDDGSTDRSPEIIRQYAATDARIHVITQSNDGVSKARNAALAKAHGEYVVLLDADDWLPQDSLLVRIKKFNESPDIAFVDGRVDIYNEAGNSIERSWAPTFRGNPYRMLVRLSPACFFGPTWMIRLGQGSEYQFDERLKYGEDLSAYVRLAQEGGKYDFVAETIYCYRNRAGSAMKNVDGLADGYLMLRKIFKAYNAFRPIDRVVFEYKIKRIMFLTYLRRGNIGKAVRYLSL